MTTTIGRFTAVVKVANRDAAIPLQERLGQLARVQLAEIFEQRKTSRVIRIDQISLDLGKIESGQLEEAALTALRKALDRHLTPTQAEQATVSALTASPHGDKQSDLIEDLEYMLQTGHRRERAIHSDLVALLVAAYDANAQAVKKRLAQIPAGSTEALRLKRQIPEATRAKLSKQLQDWLQPVVSDPPQPAEPVPSNKSEDPSTSNSDDPNADHAARPPPDHRPVAGFNPAQSEPSNNPNTPVPAEPTTDATRLQPWAWSEDRAVAPPPENRADIATEPGQLQSFAFLDRAITPRPFTDPTFVAGSLSAPVPPVLRALRGETALSRIMQETGPGVVSESNIALQNEIYWTSEAKNHTHHSSTHKITSQQTVESRSVDSWPDETTPGSTSTSARGTSSVSPSDPQTLAHQEAIGLEPSAALFFRLCSGALSEADIGLLADLETDLWFENMLTQDPRKLSRLVQQAANTSGSNGVAERLSLSFSARSAGQLISVLAPNFGGFLNQLVTSPALEQHASPLIAAAYMAALKDGPDAATLTSYLLVQWQAMGGPAPNIAAHWLRDRAFAKPETPALQAWHDCLETLISESAPVTPGNATTAPPMDLPPHPHSAAALPSELTPIFAHLATGCALDPSARKAAADSIQANMENPSDTLRTYLARRPIASRRFDRIMGKNASASLFRRRPSGKASLTANAPNSHQPEHAGRASRVGSHPVPTRHSPGPRVTPAFSNVRSTNTEPRYTSTAGIVLLWPFLHRFLTAVELVRDRSFVDDAAQRRAAMLLHGLICSHHQAPEADIALERILTALEPDQPTDRKITPTRLEIKTGESLLQGLKDHWPALRGTTVDGLRQTFLVRDGRIEGGSNRPLTLHVSKGPFDVLLDTLPWPLSTVHLPWMREVLHVKWR